MYCPKCGKQIPDGAKFCTGCGNKIEAPGAAADGKHNGKSSHAEAAPYTGKEDGGSRRITLILSIILAVLILTAAGLGIYYYKALREESDAPVSKESDQEAEDREDSRQETEEDREGIEEAEPEDGAGDLESEEAAETVEEEQGVVSDTNEVIAETILYNIPKSVYSYQFDEDLGNAQVVVRSRGESMPEVSDSLEPEYVPGMDGKAVYLDGTYGIKLSDVSKVGASYTVAFWMKADELQDWSPFIHIGHDLLDPNNRVRLWLGQKTDGVSVAPIISSERVMTADSFEIRPGRSMPNSIDPGIWYYIVFTVDGSRQGSREGSVLGTLYVAGRYICEGDIVLDTMNTDNFEVYLGINCWDALYPVAFDDVKIWDQVLDSRQIQELYDAYE